MISLYDELCEKLRRDPRLTRRGGPRVDLSLLLFNARDDLRDLWDAAAAVVTEARQEGRDPPAPLVTAVERLREIFGEREDRSRK